MYLKYLEARLKAAQSKFKSYRPPAVKLPNPNSRLSKTFYAIDVKRRCQTFAPSAAAQLCPKIQSLYPPNIPTTRRLEIFAEPHTKIITFPQPHKQSFHETWHSPSSSAGRKFSSAPNLGILANLGIPQIGRSPKESKCRNPKLRNRPDRRIPPNPETWESARCPNSARPQTWPPPPPELR